MRRKWHVLAVIQVVMLAALVMAAPASKGGTGEPKPASSTDAKGPRCSEVIGTSLGRVVRDDVLYYNEIRLRSQLDDPYCANVTYVVELYNTSGAVPTLIGTEDNFAAEEGVDSNNFVEPLSRLVFDFSLGVQDAASRICAQVLTYVGNHVADAAPNLLAGGQRDFSDRGGNCIKAEDLDAGARSYG